MKKGLIGLLALAVILPMAVQSKVYFNKRVKNFKVFVDLKDHKGKTLLAFLQDTLYDKIADEAVENPRGNFLRAVQNGEGIEVKLSHDVTTFHMKYEREFMDKAERSGRSFSAVGRRSKPNYLADASYSHYLGELDKLNVSQLRDLYNAILKVIINSDPSGFEALKERKVKEVAGDFIAVYIAEQYRNMIKGKERTGRKILNSTSHWDSAHLQTTLLASFHKGQSESNKGLFRKGRYSREHFRTAYFEGSKDPFGDRYEKTFCFYNNKAPSNADRFPKKKFTMEDYWQYNKACARSGVNITRRDWTKLAEEITEWASFDSESEVDDLYESLGKGANSSGDNFYRAISKTFINNWAPKSFDNADEIVRDSVELLINIVGENADDITEGFL